MKKSVHGPWFLPISGVITLDYCNFAVLKPISMKKHCATMVAMWLAFVVHAQNDSAFAVRMRYIDAFREIAIGKMREYKIPASITLAQGILESGAGRSDLAVLANNHFGIKCHKGWQGDYFIKDDDAKGECFRKYLKAEESFSDHSLFLTSRAHYAPLFKLDILDYKGWAYGLKAAGYATNPNYPQLLIKIIEDHRLFVYDSAGLRAPDVTRSEDPVLPEMTTPAIDSADKGPDLKKYESGPSDRQVFLLNGVKCVVAIRGDTFTALSVDFKLTPADLYYYNDLAPGAMLKAGDVIFLGKKGKTTTRDFHLVKTGETLHQISQMYGVRLALLERRNHISNRETLTPGTKIWLNTKK